MNIGKCDPATVKIDCADTDIDAVAILYRKMAAGGPGSGFMTSIKCMEKQCGDFVPAPTPAPTTVAPYVAVTPPPLASKGIQHGAIAAQPSATATASPSLDDGYGYTPRSVTGSQQDTASDGQSTVAMLANYVVIPLLLVAVVYVMLCKFNVVPAPPCMTPSPAEDSHNSPHAVAPVDYQVVHPHGAPAEETHEKKGMFHSVGHWGKKKLGLA